MNKSTIKETIGFNYIYLKLCVFKFIIPISRTGKTTLIFKIVSGRTIMHRTVVY